MNASSGQERRELSPRAVQHVEADGRGLGHLLRGRKLDGAEQSLESDVEAEHVVQLGETRRVTLRRFNQQPFFTLTGLGLL